MSGEIVQPLASMSFEMAEEVTDAAVAEASQRWYYVDPSTGSTVGPANAYQLAGLLDSAIITPESMVWAEGQEAWLPLQDIADLYAQVYHISATGSSHIPATSSDHAPGSSAASPKLTSVAAEATAKAPLAPADADLAEFNAEMTALGEDVPEANDLGAQPPRARSPSPEEKEFEDDDGTVYVWDSSLRKFQPRKDPSNALEAEYGADAMTFQGDDEEQPLFEMPVAEVEEHNSDAEEVTPTEAGESIAIPKEAVPSQAKEAGKKRAAESVMEREAKKAQRAKEQEEASKKWFDLKVNTSVYVTGLPDDVTEQQLAEAAFFENCTCTGLHKNCLSQSHYKRFAQYGVLKPDEKGAPKVKVYRDKETKMAKGDGLVTFLYEPSVELACKLADEDCFRPDMSRRMSVQPAKFEMHGTEYVPKKKGKKNKNSKEKAKIAQKVLGWGGFDDSLKPVQVTVILENMFHPEELLEEASLLKDLESDIYTECGKMGPIDKVRVFAGNPKGIVSVRFKTVEAADKCIETMSGRFFGGRQLAAHMWDGHTNYNVKLQESEEQLAARRAAFAAEIEAQELQTQQTQENNADPI